MREVIKWMGLVVLAVVVGLALAYGYTTFAQPSRGLDPISIDQAAEAASQYLADFWGPGNSEPPGQGLALTEVMEFSGNFYAEVEEVGTGVHAFELLIDRYTGAVSPEPGPNMMWNTRYGHMGGGGMGGGHMGGRRWRQDGPMPVTPDQARRLAQTWLDANMPGVSAAEEADAFYGYYTIHTLKDGEISGMLSVNGYDGAVWYHSWHGDYLGMKEMEEHQ